MDSYEISRLPQIKLILPYKIRCFLAGTEIPLISLVWWWCEEEMVQHHPDTQRFVLETFLMDSDILLIDNEGHICKECVVIQISGPSAWRGQRTRTESCLLTLPWTLNRNIQSEGWKQLEIIIQYPVQQRSGPSATEQKIHILLIWRSDFFKFCVWSL